MPEQFDLAKTENKTEEDKFKRAVPVEEIIPGIKEAILTKEDQLEESEKNNENPLSNDFWRFYLNHQLDLTSEDRGHDKEVEAEALELFKGQVIVDLGAGNSPSGYLLGQFLKAKAYVGVELYNNRMLLHKIEDFTLHKDDVLKDLAETVPDFYKHKVPFSIVQNDILSFLRRLPDNSVSILLGGIDTNIIPDRTRREEIFKEIKRVLDPKGGFLSYGSEPQDYEIKNLDLDISYPEGYEDNTFIELEERFHKGHADADDCRKLNRLQEYKTHIFKKKEEKRKEIRHGFPLSRE